MRPFGLIFTVLFLVSAFSESRTIDCRVLLGGSSEEIGQYKNHGLHLRSKELLGVVIRGYRRLRSLSSAGERMHTMASGPSRRVLAFGVLKGTLCLVLSLRAGNGKLYTIYVLNRAQCLRLLNCHPALDIRIPYKLCCKPKQKREREKATMSTMKPSRSDEMPDLDQQIKNTNQIRAGFDSLAPKRPTKPTRSEPGPLGCFSTPDQTTDHPEADKFQTLQSQTHGDILHEGGPAAVQDEFLETEYYTSLTAIDKQHHTTGSGFINVGKEEGGDEAVIAADATGDGGEKAVYRSNPATNDWIPAVEEDIASESSSKPNRSESS